MSDRFKPILVFGASGSGKSKLLEYVNTLEGVSIHQKSTTRPRRPKEIGKDTPELRFVDQLDGMSHVLAYEQYGYDYGIRRDLVREAQSKNEFHFIVVNDIEAIMRFRNLYVDSIPLYVHCDPGTIPENLQKRDTLGDFAKRQERIKSQFYDFVNNNTLFRHVLINFWDFANARIQIQNILALHEKK